MKRLVQGSSTNCHLRVFRQAGTQSLLTWLPDQHQELQGRYMFSYTLLQLDILVGIKFGSTILKFSVFETLPVICACSLFSSMMHHRRAASDTAMFSRPLAVDLKKEETSSSQGSRSATPLISSHPSGMYANSTVTAFYKYCLILGCSEVSPQPLPSPQKSPPHATQQTSQNVCMCLYCSSLIVVTLTKIMCIHVLCLALVIEC